MNSYNHKTIEKKWRARWARDKLYKVKNKELGKDNYYTLVEFPYPSGNLHIGHWYAFVVPDMFARYKRMQGHNVLFPIGFDSFGLPAENAAIERGIDPRKWTYDNIEYMNEQLLSMGAMFDWDRKIVTSDKDYYKWTQWLFLKLYKKGLAYRGKAVVNWDPIDKTVLANEQVRPDGTAERSGALVEKRELEQWFFKITDYAERLIDDLDDLDWPEEIKESQRNWIGKSEGVEIDFPVKGSSEKIIVFTTRADTIFGATYVVLAPEHILVQNLQGSIENWDEVAQYVKQTQKKSEIERTAEGKEKTGVKLEGVEAINPATKEVIPIFIADYTLVHYGTGAIMAVPAHDERDFEFAKQFNLPVIYVVQGVQGGEGGGVYSGLGKLIDSQSFTGLSSKEAADKITKHVKGRKKTTYKLRDWLLSRQRYWGCPIPIVYDPEEKAHPVPEKHLPWVLPDDVDFTPTGKSPLARSEELKERTERIFGKGWYPEYDTMDTFVDSSWYFLRYTDTNNTKEFAEKKALAAWMPVNQYSGGAEHTTMHVLYSRFFHKALYDLKLVNEDEPYRVRMNRGLILGTDGRKMSKRWGNIIDPDEQVKNVGADAVRLYLAFVGPYNVVKSYPWDLGGIAGMRRFLEKIWREFQLPKFSQLTPSPEKTKEFALHQTIKRVTKDIENFKFNTAISGLMIFVGQDGLRREKREDEKRAKETFLKLLAPFAPHLAEELWEKLGHTTSIHLESWPSHNEVKLKAHTVTIVVQVNGKVRAVLRVPAGSDKKKIQTQSANLPNVSKWLEGKTPRKVIFVPDRLINFVL